MHTNTHRRKRCSLHVDVLSLNGLSGLLHCRETHSAISALLEHRLLPDVRDSDGHLIFHSV